MKKVAILYLLLAGLLQVAFGAASAYWQSAGDLIRAGDYEAAHDELAGLLDDRPDDVLLLRLQGICLMETGREDAAVRMLRRALELDAGSVACRYYLAQALAYRGSVEEAISYLREVIALAPESEYARRAHAVIERLQTTAAALPLVEATPWWDFYARAALEYDDNVPARADGETSDTPEDSLRQTYSGYLELRPLDQTRNPLTLGIGYSIYASLHDEKALDGYDVLSQNGSAYIKRSSKLGSLPFSWQLQGDYSDTELGENPYSEIIEGGLTMDFQWCSRTISSLHYKWRTKDFENDSEYPAYWSRDGNEQRVGIGQYLYLIDNRVILYVDYTYRDNNADGSQFRLESHDVTGSVTFPFPWKLRFRARADYRHEDYTEFVPDPTRLDEAWTYYACLSRALFSEHVRIEANYTHTTSDSNQEFSNYERNVAGIALSARW